MWMHTHTIFPLSESAQNQILPSSYNHLSLNARTRIEFNFLTCTHTTHTHTPPSQPVSCNSMELRRWQVLVYVLLLEAAVCMEDHSPKPALDLRLAEDSQKMREEEYGNSTFTAVYSVVKNWSAFLPCSHMFRREF